MAHRIDLPNEIPRTIDEYHTWRRSLSELPALIQHWLTTRDLRKGETATGIAERIIGESVSRKTIENRLADFFRYRGSLRLNELDALLRYLKLNPSIISNSLTAPPPINFFRRAFVNEARDEFLDSQMLGWSFYRISPPGFRVIDAYVRRSLAKGTAQGAVSWYSSPGTSFLYVLDGRIEARFFGLAAHFDLTEGDLLFYDGNHAHSFISTSEHESVAVDVSSNSLGVSQEFFVNPFRFAAGSSARDKNLGGDDGNLDLWTRANISMALHSARISPKDLGSFTRIGAERMQQLYDGLGDPPDGDEIQELSYLLRIPEGNLYLPFSDERFNTVCRHWPRQEIAAAFEARGTLPDKDLGDYYGSGQWKVRPLLSGDREKAMFSTHRSDLSVNAFAVAGPPRAHADFIYHHYLDQGLPGDVRRTHAVEDPGEELLIVVSGHLGVRLRSPGALSGCEGTLSSGDAVWYSSYYEHAHFLPDDRPIGSPKRADALYFWSPYPVMNRRQAAP